MCPGSVGVLGEKLDEFGFEIKEEDPPKLLGLDPAFPSPLVVDVRDPGNAFDAVSIVVKFEVPPGDSGVPLAPPMTRNALLSSDVFLTQLVGAVEFLKIVTVGLEGVSADPPKKSGIELQPVKESIVKIAIF